MEFYEPINTLKPVGEHLWVVDGPIVRMAFPGGSMPFPTRMVVVRLANNRALVPFTGSFDTKSCVQTSENTPSTHSGE